MGDALLVQQIAGSRTGLRIDMAYAGGTNNNYCSFSTDYPGTVALTSDVYEHLWVAVIGYGTGGSRWTDQTIAICTASTPKVRFTASSKTGVPQYPSTYYWIEATMSQDETSLTLTPYSGVNGTDKLTAYAIGACIWITES